MRKPLSSRRAAPTSLLLPLLLCLPLARSLQVRRTNRVQPQGGPVGLVRPTPGSPDPAVAGRDYHLSVPAPQGYKDPYNVGVFDHPNYHPTDLTNPMYHSAVVPIYHPAPYYHAGGAAPPGDHRPGANNLPDEPPGVGKTPAPHGHFGPSAPSDMAPEGTARGQTKADPVNAPYSLYANSYSVHGPGTHTGQPKGWPAGPGWQAHQHSAPGEPQGRTQQQPEGPGTVPQFKRTRVGLRKAGSTRKRKGTDDTKNTDVSSAVVVVGRGGGGWWMVVFVVTSSWGQVRVHKAVSRCGPFTHPFTHFVV